MNWNLNVDCNPFEWYNETCDLKDDVHEIRRNTFIEIRYQR